MFTYVSYLHLSDLNQKAMHPKKKRPFYTCISTQKGGVGKSTLTLLTASYLYYRCGINILVVDCDRQHSLIQIQSREKEAMTKNRFLSEKLKNTLLDKETGKMRKVYPIYASTINQAVTFAARKVALYAEEGTYIDVVLFDFPGSATEEGIVESLFQMDAIFIPLETDLMVVESCIDYMMILAEGMEKHHIPLEERPQLYTFWNRMDGRQQKLKICYQAFLNEVAEQEFSGLITLTALSVSVGLYARFRRELSSPEVKCLLEKKPEDFAVFRSSFFPYDEKEEEGTGLRHLMSAILMASLGESPNEIKAAILEAQEKERKFYLS